MIQEAKMSIIPCNAMSGLTVAKDFLPARPSLGGAALAAPSLSGGLLEISVSTQPPS
jgi:hypothetical protein